MQKVGMLSTSSPRALSSSYRWRRGRWKRRVSAGFSILRLRFFVELAGEGLVREVWPGDRVPQYRSSPEATRERIERES